MPKVDLQSNAIFEEMKKHVASSPELVQKVKGIFLWKITKDGKVAAKWSKHIGLVWLESLLSSGTSNLAVGSFFPILNHSWFYVIVN